MRMDDTLDVPNVNAVLIAPEHGTLSEGATVSVVCGPSVSGRRRAGQGTCDLAYLGI
jgi:hypothetical protein